MKKIRPHHIVSVLAIGGIVFAALGSQPFHPIEEFVIFGSEKVHLAEDAQSLRGSIGSNQNIQIAERAEVLGDLFGETVHLADGAEIAGDVFAQDLKLADGAVILGASSTDITFPIAQIPAIPDFEFGTEDIIVELDSEATISAGSFRDVKIGPHARVTFSGGTYNLRSLQARENARLIFEASSTLNIAENIGFSEEVLFFPKNNELLPENIIFRTPTKSNINIGQKANLILRLIAPNAKVLIGADSTIRGNVWAKEVFVGERTVLRDTLWFSIPSEPEDIVQIGNLQLFVNIVNVNFSSEATAEDAERIAQLINATIKGFEPSTNLYSFQISTRTKEELDAAINSARSLNDPKIEGVFGDVPIKATFPF